MIQLNISSIPQKLEELTSGTLSLFLSPLKIDLIKHIENPSNQGKLNLQKKLKCCLLLTYFLENEKVNFNTLLNTLKKEEVKISEKEQLYSDLLWFQSVRNTTLQQDGLNKLGYDKLLQKYFKWHLLFKTRLTIRYEIQLTHSSKSNWKIAPERYLALLELFVDWLYRLPSKNTFLEAIENSINQIDQDVHQFWDSRAFDLSKIETALTQTRVAIWDTGVDRSCIKNLSPNLSLSYDENCEQTNEPLMSPNKVRKKDFQLYKGYLDLKIGKKSTNSITLLHELSQYNQEEMLRLKRVFEEFVVYSHGTVVASVAAKENSSIKIVPIRITFDANQYFPTLYTAKRVQQEIKMHQTIFNWIEYHKIPIVNICWAHRKQDLDTSLMNTGILDEEERSLLAEKLFTSLKDCLYEGIKNCSNTLFVVAAGNSNSILEETEFIPSSFNLPNLLAIGAVNHNGERTNFTAIGNNVQLYASGSYVVSSIPSGYKTRTSGTSIAAPQVTNIAATMLSICPSLNPKQIKQYLLENADRMSEEKILVVNPKRTINKILQEKQ